jgi:chemotaxis protein MotA
MAILPAFARVSPWQAAYPLRVFNGTAVGSDNAVQDEPRAVQDGRLVRVCVESPMDIMTGVGLVAGTIVVATLMLLGGDMGMFVSDHAIIIIFGGSISATMIRFPLGVMLHGLPLGMKFAFTMSRLSARDLVDELARIAEIARKQGPVGLEKVEAGDPFLAKGVRYVADGYDLEFIRDNLERDRDNFLMHLDEGSKIYRAIGDCAPAFGMIGTLIGMVQMFANMTDPSKLGPFMATALLATLYGALVANLLCLPIADKLHGKLLDEETNRTLIIDGILMIRDSKSPALVREMLLAYLPEKHRHEEGEPVPA